MAEPTFAEIAQEIELLETAEAFGEQLKEFTDFLNAASGGDITNWLSDDPTVQHKLGQLKDAAFQFSESLQKVAKSADPLIKAAGKAGNINTGAQTVLAFSTAVAKADESTGAEKASQMADVISGIGAFAKVLTGLSVNPVIGDFLRGYAAALQSAAIGLAIMEDYAARRNEIVDSNGQVDAEAARAEHEAAAERAESAEEARRNLARELRDLYGKQRAMITGLQEGRYRVILSFCAREATPSEPSSSQPASTAVSPKTPPQTRTAWTASNGWSLSLRAPPSNS